MERVQLEERIDELDRLRGFSLLGIFIVNMLVFHSPYLYVHPYTWYQSPEDMSTFSFIDIWIQGSVYPLFAMVFGYGLAMQYEKAKNNGERFWAFGVRRLLWLAVFGLIHGLLIWSGDILFAYALAGLLSLLFIKLSWKWILAIAAIVYLLPNGLMTYVFMLIERSQQMNLAEYVDVQNIQNSVVAYATGDFSAIMTQRLADWNIINGSNLYYVVPAILMPYVLIGFVAQKVKLIENYKQRYKLWLTLIIVGVVLGTAMKLLPYKIGATETAVFVQDVVGGPLQAIGYAGIIVLLSSVSRIKKLLRPVEKLGKMSFTIYIMQSIVATTLFYSYGFALYGKVDVLAGTLIAIGIYFLQIIFAELWFVKYKQGPLEALWRYASYKKFK